MVVGASGLGKSNFIEFLLKQVDFEAATELLKNEPVNESSHSLSRLTKEIKPYSIEKSIGTNENRLRLTVYDSPGYGSKMHADFNAWMQLITHHIKTLHVRHHNSEQALKKNHSDPVTLRNKLR